MDFGVVAYAAEMANIDMPDKIGMTILRNMKILRLLCKDFAKRVYIFVNTIEVIPLTRIKYWCPGVDVDYDPAHVAENYPVVGNGQH